MEVVWNGCEHQAFSNRKSHKPDIHSWLMKYKAKKVYEHTLQSLREAVGLGSPSKALYTIGNESQSINYGNVSTTRKSSGVHSTRRQGKLFEQQQHEVERPLLDVGSIAFVLSTSSLHLRVYKSWSNVSLLQTPLVGLILFHSWGVKQWMKIDSLAVVCSQ